jgi:hypothetical protein
MSDRHGLGRAQGRAGGCDAARRARQSAPAANPLFSQGSLTDIHDVLIQ